MNGAHAEDRVSLRLALTNCGLAKRVDIAADKEDPILQSLRIIHEFPSLAEEVASGAQETFNLVSQLLLG